MATSADHAVTARSAMRAIQIRHAQALGLAIATTLMDLWHLVIKLEIDPDCPTDA
jgi:hypothetical protein